MHLFELRSCLKLTMSRSSAKKISRFGSVDPVEFRNQNYGSKRTDNSTKFAFAVMSEFMKDRGKQNVDLVSLSTEELNIILQDLSANVKAKNGEMYKKNSLLNLWQGLNRYFKDNDKRFDIISDSAFDMANNCFNALLRKTREVGKGDVDHHVFQYQVKQTFPTFNYDLLSQK